MGDFLIKGWCYFIYTCFWWLCYYYLTGCRSNTHFDYNTFSHFRRYSIPTSANMFLSIPPRWLYMVMLFLLQRTQLSSQLSRKISIIKNFESQLYIHVQWKSHNISYFYNIIHFRLSSGRHMHAWRAYFL